MQLAIAIRRFFSNEDAARIINTTNENIAIEESKGYRYIGSSIDCSQIPASRSAQNTEPYYVTIQDYYTQDPKVLNNNSHGMKYWLDVIWNLSLGSRTKHAWKAATILGIEPSAFLSNWHAGDLLTNTTTKAVTRRCYKIYNEIQDNDVWVYETQKVVYTEYIDCYTVDRNNNPYRKSGSKNFTYYTEHYNDHAWVIQHVKELNSLGLIWGETDRFP